MRLPLAVLALAATPAAGGDWVTADVCFTDEPKIVASALATSTLEQLEIAAEGIPNGIGKFWRIETAGGAISHLWGTMHTTDAPVLDLPIAVRDAIDAARVVAVEYDPIYATRAALLDSYDSDIYVRDDLPAGSWSAPPVVSIPPQTRDWVEAFYPLDTLGGLSAGGLTELLMVDPCSELVAGVLPVQDSLIQTYGHIAGADIVGLEAPDAFVRHLNADPDTAEALIAVYTAYLQPVEDNAVISTAAALYVQGRLGLWAEWDRALLTALYGNRGPEWLDQADAYILDARNKTFADTLEPLLPKGGVFVAVGAGHLPGEAGMVALLRDRGYTVTRIPVPGEVE